MNFIRKFFSKPAASKRSSRDPETKNDLQNLTSTTQRVSQYLAGWELDLNGDGQCYDFISTQQTTEYNLHSIYSGIQLEFLDGKLVEAYDWREGKRSIKQLSDDELGLPLKQYPINPILKFFDNLDGLHQLGGENPEEILLPENGCKVPFQYLGYINQRDPNFNWLPSTIHLMCPIYLNFDKVYLDYQNPNQPILLNREEVESIDTSYDEDLNKDSKIVFNSRKFDFVPFDDFEPPLHAGIPDWVQYPTFPKCPKSGRTMKFLCQLSEGVSAKYSNVNPKRESFRKYYEELNFWGDGVLFVFIEPEAKTVCYFIQNT